MPEPFATQVIVVLPTLCGSLDVGEHERDGSGGKRCRGRDRSLAARIEPTEQITCQFTQLRGRFVPDLAHLAAESLELCHCLLRPVIGGEGAHRQRNWPFAMRVRQHMGREQRNRFAGVPDLDQRLGEILGRHNAERVELRRHVLGPWLLGELLKGCAAPQPQRAGQQVASIGWRSGWRFRAQLGEEHGIEIIVVAEHQPAAVIGSLQPMAEDFTQRRER